MLRQTFTQTIRLLQFSATALFIMPYIDSRRSFSELQLI